MGKLFLNYLKHLFGICILKLFGTCFCNSIGQYSDLANSLVKITSYKKAVAAICKLELFFNEKTCTINRFILKCMNWSKSEGVLHHLSLQNFHFSSFLSTARHLLCGFPYKYSPFSPSNLPLLTFYPLFSPTL